MCAFLLESIVDGLDHVQDQVFTVVALVEACLGAVDPAIRFCQVHEAVCNHTLEEFHDTRGERDGAERFEIASRFAAFQEGKDDGVFPHLRAIS
jgi:Fe-S-cluster formation regulator IscX/YfhJ